jgi:hypothetical protein
MKTSKYLLYFVLCTFVLALASCEPKGLKESDVLVASDNLEDLLKAENPDGQYKIYGLNEFVDAFMSEKGDFDNDTTPYRTRSTNANFPNIYLFSIDTIPTAGPGIYIRGRITTDDYGGNFYKTMIIQQVVGGQQENLRISVDLGSSAGMYQLGQEIIIRCNGLCVGRYANQPQLCVPSYNNNIYAQHSDEKVGWAPGRIPSAVFRRVTHMIGAPDQSKLRYDTLTLSQLFAQIARTPSVDAAGMDAVRKADGRLVVLKEVRFTGQYSDYGDLKDCDTNHPDSSKNANVFAPTTLNVGHPQSRVLGDLANPVTAATTIMCSNSEYAKFAYFYLPGATKKGVSGCLDYEGTVTGILGWYFDDADNFPGSTSDSKGTNIKSYQYNWSVTPRGIPGYGVPDIQMYNQGEKDRPWIPKEYDPNSK